MNNTQANYNSYEVYQTNVSQRHNKLNPDHFKTLQGNGHTHFSFSCL